MSFLALPPEVNSARMFSGIGSGPMLAAAAAWDGLAFELASAAAAFGSVTSGLANESWQGPAAAAMAGAAVPYAGDSGFLAFGLGNSGLLTPGAGNSGLLTPDAGNSGGLLAGFGNSGALNLGAGVSGLLDFGATNSGLLNFGTLLSGVKNLGIYTSGTEDIGYVPRALYVANLIFGALTSL